MADEAELITITQPNRSDINRVHHKKGMIYIGVLLALAITLMLANFWWVGQQDKHDNQYSALAGELRISSPMLAKDTGRAVDGDADAFESLRESRDRFLQTLETLKEGDSNLSLPATPVEIRDRELVALEETWYAIKNNADVILKHKDALLTVYQARQRLQNLSPKLQKVCESLLDDLLKQGLTANQAVLLAKQTEIIERTLNDLEYLVNGNDDSSNYAEQFAKDIQVFSAVLSGLKNGDSALNLMAVKNQGSLGKIYDIERQYETIRANVASILQASKDFLSARRAAKEIFSLSSVLLDKATALTHAYAENSEKRLVGHFSGYFLAAICLLLLCLLAHRAYADTKLNLSLSAAQNRGNQSAISRLLHELAYLADGDLTTQATVSDDITGAIAESVNYAINALRKLVFTINETAVQVSQAAQDAQSTSAQLADASENQAREVIAATAAINAMAVAIEHVSTNASESAQVAEKSVEIASNGVEVVQNTIRSMDKIREQIQETSKRIKRLGESSQEIGDTVSLIDDIADQTNILALNAAIQAAMAGDAGRGFAVVSDEVQRLAERSSEATRQIDSLVKIIQLDTSEAMASMEQSTSEVVKGARKAQDAGVALEKIESVSTHLAELIQNISNASQQQAIASGKISKTMSVIQEITTQTASGTLATAGSIGNLAELAVELRNSVAGFNLPAESQ